MSIVPQDGNELVVQRTDLEPTDPKDSRKLWQRFIDALRTTIGLKPIYLAERWAIAKVRQEEADADARLLAAKAHYELAMAEARRIELEAQAKYTKDMAEADRIRILNELAQNASNQLVADILNAHSQSPEETLEYLSRVIQQISLHGGTVEIDLPDQNQDEEAT